MSKETESDCSVDMWYKRRSSGGILILLFLFSALLLSVNSEGADGKVIQEVPVVAEKDMNSRILKLKSPLADMDSLLVIHFHPTVQCSCCINVGSFSRKGLEKHYGKAFKDGRILFKECNIDEDSLAVKKYSVFGSALGFSKFRKGKEEFKEIESVWEFCEDENKFLKIFRIAMEEFLKGKKQPGEGIDSTESKVEQPESKSIE